MCERRARAPRRRTDGPREVLRLSAMRNGGVSRGGEPGPRRRLLCRRSGFYPVEVHRRGDTSTVIIEAMPIPENEVRLWIRGLPKSEQNKGRFAEYTERIRAEARTKFAEPLTTSVEVKILFKDRKCRPDVDNVEKKIVDALQTVAIVDDRQVRKKTSAVIDEEVVGIVGDKHQTLARLHRGEEFLIIIVIDRIPSIAMEVESS